MREARWESGWFRVPSEVRWRDLDGLGHVNNAVFFSFFEWARTKYWLALRERSAPSPESIEFIVAHAECDFIRQLGLLEQIETLVRVGEIRTSSFDFEYEIRRIEGNELVATGKVVAVHYSWSKNAKAPIGDDLRSRIRAFQHEGEG